MRPEGDLYCQSELPGSVTSFTDSAGASKVSYRYDSFGNVLAQSGATTSPYQFSSKETDPTGLVYFGERYYDPKRGRFITVDPSGMSDGPNLYLYCLNDPVNFVDPWGLSQEEAGLISYPVFHEIAADTAIIAAVTKVPGLVLQAGFYGGWRTVVYSGLGQEALAAATSGVPIFKTFLGSKMMWFEETFKAKIPQIIWDKASAIYASTAVGKVTAFISNSSYSSTFVRIEAPILEKLEKLGIVEIIYQ